MWQSIKWCVYTVPFLFGVADIVPNSLLLNASGGENPFIGCILQSTVLFLSFSSVLRALYELFSIKNGIGGYFTIRRYWIFKVVWFGWWYFHSWKSYMILTRVIWRFMYIFKPQCTYWYYLVSCCMPPKFCVFVDVYKYRRIHVCYVNMAYSIGVGLFCAIDVRNSVIDETVKGGAIDYVSISRTMFRNV